MTRSTFLIPRLRPWERMTKRQGVRPGGRLERRRRGRLCGKGFPEMATVGWSWS